MHIDHDSHSVYCDYYRDENSRIDHGASHPQAMENTDSHQIEDAR